MFYLFSLCCCSSLFLNACLSCIYFFFLFGFVFFFTADLATSADCYYNYNHYSEGDRILTNEPCLNCTCHNKMLMCYLKVCPFTKPIGQDCTIEKREDQCCPIITCPEGKYIEPPPFIYETIKDTGRERQRDRIA